MKEEKKRLTLEEFKQKKNNLTKSLEHVTGGQVPVEEPVGCWWDCDDPADCHDH